MGVVTDFIVADASDAQKLGDQRETFDGLGAKGIDQVRMGTLYALLTNTEYNPAFLVTDESFAYTASDDGPWVQPIPDDMVRLLAKMSPPEQQRIGDEWFKTEEFDPKYSRWTRADVSWFLNEVQQLASRAVAEGKTLFMWTCL
jgi:hypothetical protein